MPYILEFVLPYLVIVIVLYIVMNALMEFIWLISAKLLEIVNYFMKVKK